MQDILGYMMREIIPMRDFVLIEKLGCTCQALALTAARIRAGAVFSKQTIGEHPKHGRRRMKYEERVYGVVICTAYIYHNVPIYARDYVIKCRGLMMEYRAGNCEITITRDGLKRIIWANGAIQRNTLANNRDRRKLAAALEFMPQLAEDPNLSELPRLLHRC